ncbi:MAG TPA: hypothetical protein DCR37_03075 [Glaciecola sp.]|nr:hypothetical protein [Glaciecola sp.]
MTADVTLEKFGYKFGQSGAHSARSIMLVELRTLFVATPTDALQDQYKTDICDYNLLDKPTVKSRTLTYRHLIDLYGMSPDVPLFRVFRRLWDMEEACQPLLALQLALVRDPLLRLSSSLIVGTALGSPIIRQDIEELLKAPDPQRFSPASLKSFAQNINGSWTQAGFLRGRNKKARSQPLVSPVNTAFALFLAYLEGASGERLLQSPQCKLFGLTDHHINELAIAAGHRGLIDFKQSGGVTEVRFTDYLAVGEEEWLHE